MDLNIYMIEWWAKERMGEVLAAVTRERLVESARQRPELRVTLGLALIGLGQRLLGGGRSTAAATLSAGTSAAS